MKVARPAPATPRAALALAVLCAAQFVLQLDFSVVNVALPSIRSGLSFSASGLQWVVTGYALTFGSLLLLGGRAGDLFGQRRVLLIGLSLFGVASIGCGVSPSPEVLIASRLIQGMAGALMAPSTLSSLTLLYPDGPTRVRALGIWQGATAAGATAGIVLGGLLVELVGWRSIFLINVPIVMLLILAVPRVIPNRRRAASREGSASSLQLRPSLLATFIIAAIIFGLSNLETSGPLNPLAIMPFLAGLAAAVVFVVMQIRTSNPLIPRSILDSKERRGALIAMLVTGGVLAAYVYFVSLYLQTVLHLNPLATGIALVPATVTIVVISSFLARRIIAPIGLKTTALLGSLSIVLGQSTFAFVSDDGSYTANILPGLLLTAAGIGVLLPCLSIAATTGITVASQGEGASLLTTAQQVGAALGVATLATIAATRSAGGTHLSAGFSAAFIVSAIAMLGVLVVIVLAFDRKPRPGASPVASALAATPAVERRGAAL